MDPDRTPLTGTIAGRYEIRREAGRGGMAVVYLAWDLRHDRPVALKVLRPEIGRLLGADRFLREIQIAAHLAHPHVLGVIDSGVIEVEGGGSLPYYVMPFVQGQSLGVRLTETPPLGTGEAISIAAEVADALQYAHGCGVIHRDIKPANILLQEGHALVADFGIAKMLAEGAGSGSATGLAIGTPGYMSPEQFSVDQPVDGRSDVYSLGCVLREMLSGAPRSPGHQALGATVSPALRQVIERALAPSPADRYPGAAELRDALNDLRTPGGILRTTGAKRRVARLAAAAVVALLAVLVATQLPLAGGRGDSVRPTRILVAYFKDLAGDDGQSIADQITESLADRLQAVPDLVVTASTAVAPYRGAPIDSLRIRFPVDRVVTGTVSRSGDSTTVVARIVDPANGRLLQAKTFRAGPEPHITGLVDGLSAFVRETLWQEMLRAQRRRQVPDDSAWRLVEQATVLRQEAEDAIVFRADRQGFKALDRADSLFAAAQLRDRRSVLIPLEIATTAERRAFLSAYIRQDLIDVPGDLPDPRAAGQAALDVIGRVLKKHPRTAEAHELRGEVLLRLSLWSGEDSSLAAAVADLELAKTIAPKRVRAWVELSQGYLLQGRYPESQLAVAEAGKVDGFQLHRKDLLRRRFELALLTGDSTGAVQACREAIGQWRGDERFADCEVELWGRFGSDRASAVRALAITDSLARVERGGLSPALRALWSGAVLARAGLGDSSDRVAARALAALGLGQRLPSVLLVEAAGLRLLRGDPDSALALIAFAVRANGLEAHYVRGAPWFKEARRDRRFVAALQGISPREAAGRP